MNFLRALFWIVLTVVVLVFSFNNWTMVTISLFGGIAADVKLPILVLAAFLVGFLPMLAWHKAARWRLRRRIGEVERARDAAFATPAILPEPLPTNDPVI